MSNYSIILFILALMVGLSAWADKIKVSYPILLITAGIAIGFVPGMPVLDIDSEVVFLIFLPPLLYDAASTISFKSFRKHISTISNLAIGLVFITTCGIAVLAYYAIPDMTWPLAFVLGAILSATDAVAAINITRNLGLPHNVATILEGESLINDASALVAYRFAVAAVTGSVFVLWKASLVFLLLIAGGVVVGLLIWRVQAFLLRTVRHNELAVTSFLLLAPFVTYLLAEELHVSGVIAVVTLGLGTATLSSRKFPESLKMQSRTLWDMIVFMLNGLIFILIGLEFSVVSHTIDSDKILPYVGYALLIAVGALLLRMARVFLQQVNLQRAFTKQKRGISKEALLTYSESMVISWAGMRGIVSLAIALGLPRTLENGAPFPLRDEIIFISTVMVLFSIVGQGLILPWIVRRMRLS